MSTTKYAGEVLGRGFDYLLWVALLTLVAALLYQPLQQNTLLLVAGPVVASFGLATAVAWHQAE